MDDHAFPLDSITGLPWSASLRPQASQWALSGELHALVLEIVGLSALIDAFGYRAGQSILRQVARQVARQLDERDLLGRHSGGTLLIITRRPYAELEPLVRAVRERVFTLSIETAEGRIPEGRFGVAGMDPVTSPAEAETAVDALIISAEIALRQAGTHRVATDTGRGGGRPAAVTEPPAAFEPERPELGDTGAEDRQPASVKVPPGPGVISAPEEAFAAAVPDEPIAPPPAEAAPAPVGELATGGFAPEEEVVSPQAPLPAIGAEPIAAAPEALAPAPAQEEDAGQPAPHVPPADLSQRVTFVRCNVSDAGLAATVEVEVNYGGRTAVGKVVGRKTPERLPYLIGEATGRALTELLPRGFGVVLQDLHQVEQGDTQALWATVMLVSPDGEEKLLGIAPGRAEDGHEAPARAVLNAINRRLALILKSAP
ncbi:MAG TPA: diguanylate cyclase [bacterium]|nr:diguanylate cyclase [bacterium]